MSSTVAAWRRSGASGSRARRPGVGMWLAVGVLLVGCAAAPRVLQISPMGRVAPSAGVGDDPDAASVVSVAGQAVRGLQVF